MHKHYSHHDAGWERASTTVGRTKTSYLCDGGSLIGDATCFYNRDGLGSVRNLTDASQVVRNAYSFTAFVSVFQRQ